MSSIGVSANIKAEGSVHTQTFLRAIHMAIEDHQKISSFPPTILWENDDSTYEGGLSAAKKLISNKATIIVGHYATAAALGALHIYKETNTPLLLPAATATCLTEKFYNAFRVCSSDRELAKYAGDWLKPKYENKKIALVNDKSLHGESLINELKVVLEPYINVVDLLNDPDVILFSGSYENSIVFLNDLDRINQNSPVYFTDDVVPPNFSLIIPHKKRKIGIFGFAPSWVYSSADEVNYAYKKAHGVYPSTYFLETYSAMQIAFQCVENYQFIDDRIRFLNSETWDTALGTFSFRIRESELTKFAFWQVQPEGELVAFLKN